MTTKVKHKKHDCEKKDLRRVTGLYIIGALTLLHGLSHILLAVFSFYLAGESITGRSFDSIEHILENPYMGILWAAIGIFAIYIGYKDKKTHEKHEQYIVKLEREITELKNKQ